jgi:hypothetical protein
MPFWISGRVTERFSGRVSGRVIERIFERFSRLVIERVTAARR